MSSFICDICKRDFKSEKGCRTHSTIMHPSHIKILPKKPFCCTKCDKSFDHATTLSRHGLEHKNEEEEARQQLNNRIQELQELLDRTNRERQLELRNVALEKVVFESQQENERLTTMFYKLRSRKLDFVVKELPMSVLLVTCKQLIFSNVKMVCLHRSKRKMRQEKEINNNIHELSTPFTRSPS